MIHYRSFDSVQLHNAWATIGTFDGVHRGHQAILAPMVEQAHAAGSPAVVVTFSPHPIVVLRGIDEPMCLTTPEERASLLGDLGIDVVITLTFDKALAALSAEDFMQQMSDHLNLRQLWVGSDFALGRGRQGDIPTLQRIGEQLRYQVHVTSEISQSGERISSSRIRRTIREGNVAEAAHLLGRPYNIEGLVVHGDHRGRELGFPTANIGYNPNKILPAYGVYATWAWIGDAERVPSVTSVGIRPTFDYPNPQPKVEPYLIDFSGDLYGKALRIAFLQFLRPELRFDSAQSLINQMVQDTQNAREVLANAT